MPLIVEPPSLLTLGRLAEMLGEPIHRIDYIVRTRGIEPVGLAGRLRVFDRTGLSRIRYELNLLDARRSGGEGVTCAALPP